MLQRPRRDRAGARLFLTTTMPRSRMSASLIGRSGSSAFRLSAAAVSMSLTGSCFSSESAPGPLYGAFLVKKFYAEQHIIFLMAPLGRSG